MPRTLPGDTRHFERDTREIRNSEETTRGVLVVASGAERDHHHLLSSSRWFSRRLGFHIGVEVLVVSRRRLDSHLGSFQARFVHF